MLKCASRSVLRRQEPARRAVLCAGVWLTWLGIMLVWSVGEAVLRVLGASDPAGPS